MHDGFVLTLRIAWPFLFGASILHFQNRANAFEPALHVLRVHIYIRNGQVPRVLGVLVCEHKLSELAVQ